MWVQISSGKGPDECELAVTLFLESYIKECTVKGQKAIIVDAVKGSKSENLKSVLLSIDCTTNEDLENGTIQWICKSPYRPEHKRKNWFINIEVFKVYEKLNLNEKDIKFESMRSSGPGGQHVNKVETAIRATHLPTGLTVTASEERSQYMNKKLAIARLSSLINTRNQENFSNEKRTMWLQHNTITRGNPIRIYEGEKFQKK